MNGWLRAQRRRELRELRAQLDQASALSDESTPLEVQRRMLLHQHLVHRYEQVRAFSPRLVDARFLVQVGTSVVAVLAGNLLLRSVLDRLLE
jgi:hypothetical protein